MGQQECFAKRSSAMRARSLLVLFGSFLVIGSGLGSGYAQSSTPGFTISASNATMPTSNAGAIPFTLTSVNGFAGMVSVGCGPANPPTGSILPQCNYTGDVIPAPPYTLPANGTVTGSLNLVAYIPPCSNPCPVKLQPGPRHRGAVYAALAAVLLLGICFRRRARWPGLMLLFLGILAGVSCGTGNHSTLTPGTFAYTVSAMEITTNTPTQTVSTTVNVMVPAGIPTNLPSANP
jgi:hypothetical protein